VFVRVLSLVVPAWALRLNGSFTGLYGIPTRIAFYGLICNRRPEDDLYIRGLEFYSDNYLFTTDTK